MYLVTIWRTKHIHHGTFSHGSGSINTTSSIQHRKMLYWWFFFLHSYYSYHISVHHVHYYPHNTQSKCTIYTGHFFAPLFGQIVTLNSPLSKPWTDTIKDHLRFHFDPWSLTKPIQNHKLTKMYIKNNIVVLLLTVLWLKLNI